MFFFVAELMPCVDQLPFSGTADNMICPKNVRYNKVFIGCMKMNRFIYRMARETNAVG